MTESERTYQDYYNQIRAYLYGETKPLEEESHETLMKNSPKYRAIHRDVLREYRFVVTTSEHVRKHVSYQRGDTLVSQPQPLFA
jgi:hypothetical protein